MLIKNFFFKEDLDRGLWASLCSAALGNNSVVFEECVIEHEYLPHGSIDVLGGLLSNSEAGVKFSIGVNVEGDSFDMCNPIGTSAKTRYKSTK